MSRRVLAEAQARDDAASQADHAPASKGEIVALIIYFAAVVVLSDVFNVRLGVELLTLAVVAAAILITRAPRLFLHDWWFLLVGLIMWNLSGPIAAQSTLPWHLDFMLDLDRWLGFGHDPVRVVQTTFAGGGHIGVLDIATAAVYNLHLPEPYIAAYFLWRLNRLVYFQFAAAALLLLVLGFITFILFPAVPPWMAAGTFHRLPDVTNRFGPVLRWHPLPFHGTPIFYVFHFKGDAVAAFPSEHAAFPMLELLAFSRFAGRRATVAFGLWVVAVLFTVVYLGEHWITDAIAGYVYAIAIFAFVRWFVSRRSQKAL